MKFLQALEYLKQGKKIRSAEGNVYVKDGDYMKIINSNGTFMFSVSSFELKGDWELVTPEMKVGSKFINKLTNDVHKCVDIDGDMVISTYRHRGDIRTSTMSLIRTQEICTIISEYTNI